MLWLHQFGMLQYIILFQGVLWIMWIPGKMCASQSLSFWLLYICKAFSILMNYTSKLFWIHQFLLCILFLADGGMQTLAVGITVWMNLLPGPCSQITCINTKFCSCQKCGLNNKILQWCFHIIHILVFCMNGISDRPFHIQNHAINKVANKILLINVNYKEILM